MQPCWLTDLLASAVRHHEWCFREAQTFIVNKWRTRLTDERTEKLVNCYINLQMLRTLTNKSDDEAFVCCWNADGEEPLDVDAE